MWEKRNEYKVLVGKHEGNRPLGPRRRRLEDNIKMNFKEFSWKGVDCVYLRHYRDDCGAVVNTAMNCRVS